MINGLLHVLILDEQGGARAIDNSTELQNWQPAHGKLWVHMDYSQADAVQWLEQSNLLTDYELESLIADETRPRLTKVTNGNMLFLRGVNLNPAQSPEDMVSLRLFINENVIVTTRKRRLLSVQDVVESFDGSNGPCSISELVCQLAQNLTSRMQAVIDSLDDTLDGFEDEIDEPNKGFDHQSLAQIRRQTIALKRYLRPQKEALITLLNNKYKWLDEDDKARLNETTNMLIRYLEELDSSIERAQIIQQAITSQVSEQLNQRMYVMSVVAALFLPLGFLTGLLGVNVGGIPGTESPYAFSLFIIFLLVLTVGIGIYFKNKKWL
ncbi:zinc transporter ZntB [Pseudoalteromonas sp. MEBiC 03607]|jgi:zinc transporter|uniref:zinc transporter ZntB n=1 Tax=Pseudoalteromonas TaxID=53246 RepID=UPI000C66684E|nr:MULTISPECIES: zinc transporter ZntB [unclassified Pseudoalteromonas]MBD57403.1 zinc transporter ZntB [Pseudoalteromonas sp.]MBU75594.1 zinc transporter ZntB [Pseudoalteromonadaceae bacterium]MCF2899704.1 zinc transporter ZntB [Pseudoalteromonas sp. OFAV1]MCF2920326.1 zinc transporter ZntB [Pseudoalteromonas sp. APAL1]MCO7248889.1 zinc transporter ZntB [Pseudoalteromonas sp. Ps84H-4]|tara:strand:- start:121 stop:1092 length:972 start_codon:yes stop_codon:yes gene_type:complete